MHPSPPDTSETAQSIADRYALVSLLGTGGMGRVDLAEDLHTGARVALKRVPLAHAREAETLKRELRLRRQLAHPQIPAAYALGRDEHDESAWLALEYVDGRELPEGALAWGAEGLRDLLALALNVVGFLHRRGVIHGDLKPANFLVSRPEHGEARLWLLDFGLAHATTDEGPAPRGGTLAYMAPSQRAGQAATASTDLYALGRTFSEAALAIAPETPTNDDTWRATRAVIDRLVHADPDLRYSAAADAMRNLLDAPARLSLPGPREAPLVGRENATRWITSALKGLHAGLNEHAVLLLEGADGMGKSRMLRTARDDAALMGLRVVEFAIPHHAGPLEVPLAIAGRLLPDDARELGPVRRGLSAGGVPVGALRDLWRAIQRACRDEPVAILLDDAHRADPGTLSFLTLAARLAPRQGPLVLVAWARADGTADAQLETLTQVGAADRMRLEPLPEPALQQLAASLLPTDSPAERADEIAALSAGDPHVATLLACEGRVPGNGEGRALLDGLVDARLQTLAGDERRVLEALAILERPAHLEVIARVAAGTPDLVRRMLVRLQLAGHVASSGLGRERRHTVSQGRLRARVRRHIGPEQARRMHRAAHDAWAAWPRAGDRPPAMLVHHTLAAGDGAAALEQAIEVARQFTFQGSVDSAAALLTRLITAAEVHAPAQADPLRELLAHALVRAGRLAEASALLDGPLAAVAGNDPARDARLQLLEGTLQESRGNLRAAEEALAAVTAAPADLLDVADRMRAWERLGAAHFRQGRHDEARSVWQRGLEEAPDSDASLERANLLNDLGAIDTWQGRLDDAAHLHAEALTLRRSQGDLDGESRSLTNLANLAIKRADFRTARRHYAESLRLKREVGSLQAQAVSLSNLALVCNQLGEYGDALAQLEESLALRARAGDVIGEAITRRQCAALYLHKGELGRAGEELAQARDLLAAANAGDAYALPFAFQEAELLLQLGDARAAVARTTRTIDSLPANMRATERFDLLLLRARAHLLAGEHERARTDMRAARAGFEEQGDTLNVAWCQLEQGRLAMRLGHPGRARIHVDQALATAKALEARRLQCEAALALANLDGERDPDRAARELAVGSRLAEALGVPDLVIAAHALKGWQSLRLGQRQRALGWWRRCADAMNDALLRLRAQDDPARYLSHPQRRRILRALDALVCAEEERRGLTEEVLR